MIHLSLAIDKGDTALLRFVTVHELLEFVKELNVFDCVWVATTDNPKGEILITENIDILIDSISRGHFRFFEKSKSISKKYFYIQKYNTYEAAYKVALDMREENPKCYE